MPLRPVVASARAEWLKLADIFKSLLGGTEETRRASLYLTQLATDTLPREELAPLLWHSRVPDMEVMPIAAEGGPHEVVLAVLCPSVPLRVVWHRGR